MQIANLHQQRLKYTPSNLLREGYWRGVTGKYYPLSLAQEGSQGWVIYKGSANMASNSVKWLGRLGNVGGVLSTAYNSYNFVTNPNWDSGLGTAIGVGSYFFWELGAIYGVGSIMVGASAGEINQRQENIMNNRDPLYNVYNPSLGY